MTDRADAAFNAKSDERLSANCPALVKFSSTDAKRIPTVSGFIVNLSVSGCLVSSDAMPWNSTNGVAADISASDVAGRICRVHLPWSKQHYIGTVRRVGGYIMGIEFQHKLRSELVREIARLEPGSPRRGAPEAASKQIRSRPAGSVRSG